MEGSCHLLGASSSSPILGGSQTRSWPLSAPSHQHGTGWAGSIPIIQQRSGTSQTVSLSRTRVPTGKEVFGGGGGKGHGPPEPREWGAAGEGACRLREGGSAGEERRGRCGAADKPARNNKRLHYTSVLAGESGRRPATGPRSARHPQRGQRSGCWHEERDPLGLRVGERRAGCSGRDKKDKIEENPAGHVTCGTFGQATSGPADASSGP